MEQGGNSGHAGMLDTSKVEPAWSADRRDGGNEREKNQADSTSWQHKNSKNGRKMACTSNFQISVSGILLPSRTLTQDIVGNVVFPF